MAVKKPEVFEGVASVGMTVLWYKDANSLSRPIPAIVHQPYEGGFCDLIVLQQGGQEMRRSVWHIGNPGLRHRDTGKATSNALNNGAWDFTEWSRDEYEYRQQQKAKAAKAKPETDK